MIAKTITAVLKCSIVSLFEADEDVYFIIGGDLNTRIGEWFFMDDKLDEDFRQQKEGDTFERQSQDQVTNVFGKTLISLCTTVQFTPLNGLIDGDGYGQFTFFSERAQSCIHYFCVFCGSNCLHEVP